ncbi:hypothetical protein KKB18_02360, partial [bacterium]|nr:hypothetical protein [bacterium]
LDNNQLTTIPERIGELKNLQTLWLDNNPLKYPPPEIVSQGTDAILAFLRERLKDREEQKETRRYGAKLIILGDGKVGKTCVSRALRGKKFIEGHKTTIGVEVGTWTFSHPDHKNDKDKDIKLNIWDFGGQEINHPYSQFFLTGRSLYLLVFNGREGLKEDRILYWLDTIRSLAPREKVILVASECERNTPYVPWDRLQAEYSDLLKSNDSFIMVDCKPSDKYEYGMNIPMLQNKLKDMAKNLDVIGIPWISSYEKAESAINAKGKDRVNHINRDGLYRIFKESAVKEENNDTLARLFGDMGVITHFPDHFKLKDFIVLKPEWLTKAISLVLENPKLEKEQGEFEIDWLQEVWGADDEFREMSDKFYECMKAFELCYQLEYRPKLNLVPLRFSHKKPDHIPWSDIPNSKERRIQYKFNIRPPAGIMSRLIVKTHHLIPQTKKMSKGVYWFNGVFLRAGKDGMLSEALCEFNKDERTLTITVRAAYPQEMIEQLNGFAVAVFSFFKGLMPERFYGCVKEDESPCEGIHSESTIKFHQTLKRKIACQPGYHEVDPVFLVTGQSSFSVPCYVDEELSNRFIKAMIENPEWMEKFGSGLTPIMQRLDYILFNQYHIIKNQAFFFQFIMQQNRELLNWIDMLLDARDFTPIPSIFILSPVKKSIFNPQRFFEQEYVFMPYCEDEKQIHRVDYSKSFKAPKEWWIKAAPILSVMVKVLTFSASVTLAGMPIILDVSGIKNEIELMKALVSNMPKLEGGAKSDVSVESMKYLRHEMIHGDPGRRDVDDPYREARLALSEILEKVAPMEFKARRYGELTRVKMPDNTFRWLCMKHRDAVNKYR